MHLCLCLCVRGKPGRYGKDGRDNGVEDRINGGVALGFIPNVPGCRVVGQPGIRPQ